MKKKVSWFDRVSNKITHWTGTSTAFGIAAAIIIFWAVSGPVFKFSDTWQLVVNTGTTIVTFLMVFLIQKAQNKDSKAIQLKLNELIAASEIASNRMVDIEDLEEDELDLLYKFYRKLAEAAALERDIHRSHSIDTIDKVQAWKSKGRAAQVV